VKKLALHWQILIAILLAGVAGWLSGKTGGLGDFTFYGLYDFLGRIFLNALKMIIVPLILSSIIIGIAGIGRASDLGKLGGKTIGFYLATGLFAVLTGLAVVNLIKPGIENGEPVRAQLALAVDQQQVQDDIISGKGLGELVEIFVRMVPQNIVETASNNGDLLALIFFALLFGFFMTRVDNEHAEPLYKFWNAIFKVMMRITEFVMKFAPLGVFGLVAKVVADTGLDAVRPLVVFAVTVLVALMTHALITMPLLLRFIGNVSPFRHYRAVSPALLTAFSTASSSGTLPITLVL